MDRRIYTALTGDGASGVKTRTDPSETTIDVRMDQNGLRSRVVSVVVRFTGEGLDVSITKHCKGAFALNEDIDAGALPEGV